MPILKLACKRVGRSRDFAGVVAVCQRGRSRATAEYENTLFRGNSVHHLPSQPRFSFTATSLQSGVLWRFAKDYAADWRVGRWSPNFIAVRSARQWCPRRYLSPAYVDVPKMLSSLSRAGDLSGDGFHPTPLSYRWGHPRNLGLEPIWKTYPTILVSDGGAVTAASSLGKAELAFFGDPARLT